MLTKSIGYAYPTSETATKNGFGKTGCYFLELCEGWTVKQKLHFVATKAEAIAYAESLPFNWSIMYSRLYDVNDGHRHLSYEESQKVYALSC